MRHIYSNATVVNTWLGPAGPEVSGSAAGIISTLAFLSHDTVEREHFPKDEDLQSPGLPTRGSLAWKALNTMFELPYFERIWIIQEIAVAPSFTILWSNMEIPKCVFEKFKKAAVRKTEVEVGSTENVIMAIGNLKILDYSYVEVTDCAEHYPLWAPRWEPTRLDDDTYLDGFIEICDGRRFFITEKGFVVIGPYCMKSGDMDGDAEDIRIKP
ncbi:putative HET-6OR heterokaryon incompatibility protein (het-6OR allele) [Fusarium austroafricanum]|uniref:Putative HET-6OR heterokaryon incompatibility protein (Het-6OR allele) n=1 Tax=Fusarium austroafricanum TaxID=2364996 RepID=A0A8H4JU80_9HYPO|nr:putative HET-6OR heterokaryon incompatibility protein (het-6OR allele) [Fusarium austroafricanum]